MPTLKQELAKVTGSRSSLRATFYDVACECGKPMKRGDGFVYCDRDGCEHAGKHFNLPSIEIDEQVP